jgi:hypothetical protein
MLRRKPPGKTKIVKRIWREIIDFTKALEDFEKEPV